MFFINLQDNFAKSACHFAFFRKLCNMCINHSYLIQTSHKNMLEIQNLTVTVEEKTILSTLSHTFEKGKTYALLGHNGSGKSSLAFTIAGHPKYQIADGRIAFDGQDITKMPVDERAKLGIFLSFQNVPEIPGVRLSEFLRTIYNAHLQSIKPETKPLSPFLFGRFIAKEALALGIDKSFLDRDLFVGFSGGEKRRIELLAMKLLEPKCIILDEIDSGLDIDAFEIVADAIRDAKNPETTLIIVTHNFRFLKRI